MGEGGVMIAHVISVKHSPRAPRNAGTARCAELSPSQASHGNMELSSVTYVPTPNGLVIERWGEGGGGQSH